MNNRQDITSSWTAFYKFILPIGWCGVFGIGALSALFRAFDDPALMIFPIVWLAGSTYLFYWSRSLRFVSVDEHDLYVSVGSGEVKIPFSQIKEVRESFWTNPKQITLLLREPSGVGEKIVFLPAFRFFGFVAHPTAKKLRKAAKAHRW